MGWHYLGRLIFLSFDFAHFLNLAEHLFQFLWLLLDICGQNGQKVGIVLIPLIKFGSESIANRVDLQSWLVRNGSASLFFL